MAFALFPRKKNKQAIQNHPGIPAIRCSICTGEQVAGLSNPENRKFEAVVLLKTPGDLEEFKQKYGISGEIDKFY